MPARRISCLGVALVLATAPFSPAAETSAWPTWRGSSGQGIAPGAQPPTTWGDEQNVKWKTKIPGHGMSTPIIWKDRIFLLTAVQTEEEGPAVPVAETPPPAPAASPAPAAAAAGAAPAGGGGQRGGGRRMSDPAPTKFHEFAVVAVDRKTGKIEWQKTARKEVPHEGRHATNSFASGSPVTDGERLWVPFGSRGFYCYDLKGNLIWEKDFGDMRTRGGFGEGASPALAGDVLIITWDHEEKSFVVAVDKNTGAEVWKKSRDERTSWTTPLIVEVGGKLQAIVAGAKQTRSYDVATGDVIWEATGLTQNVVPTPVTGHGMVYVMSGFQGNVIQAIKLSSKGDVTGTENIVWSARRSAPYVPSPVLSGDRLYMSKSNDAFLSCLNALTGEVHYQDQKLEGVRGIYASPIAANGHLYVVGRDGTVMVLKDAPQFEIVATNKLNDKIDASPVMLGKELFLRGHDFLYCIAES